MKRDTNSFQERYNRWKNGENYWDIVDSPLPQYRAGGSNTKIVMPGYKGGKSGHDYEQFVTRIGPVVYNTLRKKGIANPVVYDHMMRQLAFESAYGTSNQARTNHNYGGVGYNGKTYTKYDSDEAFVNSYVDLMRSRYGSALNASDIDTYSRQLKKAGYYQDSLEHYTNQLRGMQSVSRYAKKHMQLNPGLYDSQILQDQVKKNEVVVPDNTRVDRPVIVTPTYNVQRRLNIPISSTTNVSDQNYTLAPTVNSGTNPLSMNLPPITQTMQQLYNDQPMLNIPQFKGGKDDQEVTVTDPGQDNTQEYIEAGLGFLPYIGTAIDIKNAVKNPTLENIGWAVAGGVADIAGLGGAIRGLRTASRAKKLFKLAMAANRYDEGRRIAKIASKNTNMARKALAKNVAYDVATNFIQNRTSR